MNKNKIIIKHKKQKLNMKWLKKTYSIKLMIIKKTSLMNIMYFLIKLEFIMKIVF
jgi:hypothetical protein